MPDPETAQYLPSERQINIPARSLYDLIKDRYSLRTPFKLERVGPQNQPDLEVWSGFDSTHPARQGKWAIGPIWRKGDIMFVDRPDRALIGEQSGRKRLFWAFTSAGMICTTAYTVEEAWQDFIRAGFDVAR